MGPPIKAFGDDEELPFKTIKRPLIIFNLSITAAERKRLFSLKKIPVDKAFRLVKIDYLLTI
jgi:hypothetical protein